MISGILGQQAILQTNSRIFSNIPAIATLSLDQELISEAHRRQAVFLELPRVSASDIREIGSLEQVERFDYRIWSYDFFSRELERYFNGAVFETPLEDHHSLRFWGADRERFTLTGVHDPDIFDIQGGLIQLEQGRTFTREEIETGAKHVLVSQPFLEKNNLAVGGKLTLDFQIFDPSVEGFPPEYLYSEKNILASTMTDFLIIGTFSHPLPAEPSFDELLFYKRLANRIYVPNRMIEATAPMTLEILLAYSDSDLSYYLGIEDFYDQLFQFENIIFMLDSPQSIPSFLQEAGEKIPSYWRFNDLSSAYRDLSQALASLETISGYIFIGTLLSSVVLMGGVLCLQILERRKEIGLYLCLGKKRTRIIFQLMYDVFFFQMASLFISILAGFHLTARLSTAFVQNSLIAQSQEERILTVHANTPESMGFMMDLSFEELLAAFGLSLTSESLIQIVAATAIMSLLAILLPSLYLLTLTPKNILLAKT